MFKFESKVGGMFRLSIVKADGSTNVVADWFPNLITNSGMDFLGDSAFSNFGEICRVGSGNDTPAFTDTALETQVAEISYQDTGGGRVKGTNSSSPYDAYVTYTYRFPAGAAAGNLSEIGVSPAGAGFANISCRALILDGLGAPTTITVLSDEILVVDYRLSQFPPLSDVTDTIVISGVSYDYTIRAAYAGQDTDNNRFRDTDSFCSYVGSISGNPVQAYETQTLGAITGDPAGTSYPGTSAANSTYTSGDYYRDVTYIGGISELNAPGGIGSLVFFNTRGSYQISFDPLVDKDDTKRFDTTYRFSWVRL